MARPWADRRLRRGVERESGLKLDHSSDLMRARRMA
jgi:hypothetical protein